GKELARRPYGPGQHGNARKGKLSDYGTQLKEKQKVRFMYGVNERQFKKTFNEASKMQGIQGTNFLRLLESRLDNLVYRIGFASTRRGARQLVNHGHVTVNGKKVDIPSYRVKPGDVISIKEDDKNLKVVAESLAKVSKRVEFISYDEGKMEGTYVRLPERNELNADINEALIVEFYNK
ncbi:MAG: 30S ribosomal protein S4, partial [Bacilli bacterium]|nr:30S ribosomal protein S4 [Bacilli bacterium]